MAGFPKVQPALTLRIDIKPGLFIGSSANSNGLTVVPVTKATLTPVDGYEGGVSASLLSLGYDYIRADASGTDVRLDVGLILKTEEGTLILLKYAGVLNLTEGVKAIFAASPVAKSVDFGSSAVAVRFETGDPSLRHLETGLFVGQGRFIVEEGSDVAVEYNISHVTPA